MRRTYGNNPEALKLLDGIATLLPSRPVGTTAFIKSAGPNNVYAKRYGSLFCVVVSDDVMAQALATMQTVVEALDAVIPNVSELSLEKNPVLAYQAVDSVLMAGVLVGKPSDAKQRVHQQQRA